MWYAYLKQRIIEEKDTVIRLLLLDKEIQGFTYSYQELLSFLDETPSKITLEENATYLLEGKSKDFIRLLNAFPKENLKIIIEETSLGLNKWIYKIYKEFCTIYIPFFPEILFSNTYSIEEGKAILIGSSAFCEELSSCLHVPCVKIKTS